MHWVDPIMIVHDTSGIVLNYDYLDPHYYRIDPASARGDEHYILETRLRDGFDRYIPNPPGNFTNQSGILLIWHQNGVATNEDPDKTCLMFADNVSGETSYLTCPHFMYQPEL
jgi:hypothetical protein